MSILDKIKDVFKGETPEQKLRKAIEKGDAKKVKALLDAGVSPFVFFEDSEGITTPHALAKFYSEQSPQDKIREKILQKFESKKQVMELWRDVNKNVSDYLGIEKVIEDAGKPLTKEEFASNLSAVRAAREEEEQKQGAELEAELSAAAFGIDEDKEVRREATLAEKNDKIGQGLRKRLANQLQEVRKKHGPEERKVASEDPKINETRNQLDERLLSRILEKRCK